MGFEYRRVSALYIARPRRRYKANGAGAPNPAVLGDGHEQRYRFEFQSDGKRTADN
jgi:hypothetical protein